MTEAEAFIAAFEDPRKRESAETLDRLFRDVTGFRPKLWQGRMLGYGQYDYTYKTGHSGTWLASGFAIGARQITIYILPGYTEFPDITPRIGKHKQGKSCIYFTKLEHIEDGPLRELIAAGLRDLETHFPVQPT